MRGPKTQTCILIFIHFLKMSLYMSNTCRVKHPTANPHHNILGDNRGRICGGLVLGRCIPQPYVVLGALKELTNQFYTEVTRILICSPQGAHRKRDSKRSKGLDSTYLYSQFRRLESIHREMVLTWLAHHLTYLL